MPTRQLSLAAVAAGALFLPLVASAPLHAQAAGGQAGPSSSEAGGACNRTTDAADDACERQAQADHFLALGVCANLADPGRRTACVRTADGELRSAPGGCGEQEEAREKVCKALGQAPYDPPIRPSDFTTRITNPYFPLRPGTVFSYKSDDGDETTVVAVTSRTVTILGVRCVVVRDTVREDGRLVEDTEDYYAQDKAGNVWYFGEATAEFEGGVAVNNNGAWIAGVDGAKPGIVMPANPRPGLTYRQEFALGVAEDVGRVESVGEPVRVPFGAFPDTLKTLDTVPLEPDAREHKYYAKGVGFVLAVDLTTGDRDQLVSIKRP